MNPELFRFAQVTCCITLDVRGEILEEIKQIVDESDARGQFILSGFQKLELMKGVSESLAGRVSL